MPETPLQGWETSRSLVAGGLETHQWRTTALVAWQQIQSSTNEAVPPRVCVPVKCLHVLPLSGLDLTDRFKDVFM